MMRLDEYNKTLSAGVYRLINDAALGGGDLEEIFGSRNLSYNDLRYESNPQVLVRGGRYKTLDDYRRPFHAVPVVSFFSGCGGLDLGFEAAGFEHVALIEHSRLFCETVRRNRNWNIIGPPHDEGDISQRARLSDRLEKAGVYRGFNGIFIGGPPCQPFSIAANQRFAKNGANFKRTGFDNGANGGLLFDYVWFIQKYLPRAFLIENVPGVIDIDSGEQVSKVYKLLAGKGYAIHQPLKINAAHYGVPQQRERVFIVGYRGKKAFIPPAAHGETVPCINALLGIDYACPNHMTRKHKAHSIARYIKLAAGKRDKLGRVDRLDPALPAKTVIAGGTSGGGRSHLHPYIPRTLSVRECARLQTFPDDYIFTGALGRQFTQVGNAVPPVLAAQLAQAIYQSFFADAAAACCYGDAKGARKGEVRGGGSGRRGERARVKALMQDVK